MAPARPPRVLLVDDDEAFLDAVVLTLAGAANLVVARNVVEALAVREAPDAAFIDLGLPDGDGTTLVRRFAERWPDVPSVVLTACHADRAVLEAFRAGARGYLYKEDLADRLFFALEEALAGGAPMSREVARLVLATVSSTRERVAQEVEQPVRLTSREHELLTVLAGGCTYEQAAATLSISVNTVRTHVRSLYEKLAVGSRTEAVIAGIRLGLVRND